jgi:2-methylcitrate dehydratase PrpD
MEYAVASALVRGRVDLDTFSEEALTDATVQRMRDVVDFSVDDSLDYDAHEAYVRIETTDGSYERRRHDPPGTHDDPLGPDETRAKFEECVGRAFDEERSAQLYETCATLPQHRSVQAALSEL